MASQPTSVILVDSQHLVYRSWHTHEKLQTADGRRTGVLHGFLTSILSMSKKNPQSSFIFAWEGRDNWRKQYSKVYKANRGQKDDPEFEHVLTQMSILQKTLMTIGLRQCQIVGLEGDDIIGILSHTLEFDDSIEKVLIYSGDKDFFQLITDKVNVVRMEPKGLRIVTSKDVKREFGIVPKQWVKMRALCGDASDNLKPVKGIGPKKAVGCINAGVDASCETFEAQPLSVQKQYRDLRLHWKKIHECYVLSNLPRDEKHAHLKPETQTEIKRMIKEVSKNPGRLQRTVDQKEENLQELTNMLAGYELSEVLSDRTRFWQIP